MMLRLIDDIIGHLGAAQVQRAASDDKIIMAHIDDALKAAKILRLAMTGEFEDRAEKKA